MNIYNNLGIDHIIFAIPFGYKPYHIVGIINDINNTLSLYVQSCVNEIYGVFIPPVNLLVTFNIYDADNNTDIKANAPNTGTRFNAPANDNNSPIKLTDKGVPILQKLNIIKYIANIGIYVNKP